MSDRERDYDYSKIVAVINANYRVIECADGIQWIVQKRYPSQWQGQKYHRSRDALITAVRRVCGDCSPQSLAVLHALPDWIHEQATPAIKLTGKQRADTDASATTFPSILSVHPGVEEYA